MLIYILLKIVTRDLIDKKSSLLQTMAEATENFLEFLIKEDVAKTTHWLNLSA